MPEYSASGLSPADVQALIAASGVPQFVAPGTMTVAQMLATYPAGASTRGKYVRVSDYGGFVDRVLRCDYDSGLNLYFWTPTQPEYGRSIDIGGGNINLMALTMPPSVVLTGTIGLGVTRTFTIDLANRRPGELIEVKAGLTSLLGGLNILGTGLGSGVAILLGGYQKYLVDGSSGSLQLVRLV